MESGPYMSTLVRCRTLRSVRLSPSNVVAWTDGSHTEDPIPRSLLKGFRWIFYGPGSLKVNLVVTPGHPTPPRVGWGEGGSGSCVPVSAISTPTPVSRRVRGTVPSLGGSAGGGRRGATTSTDRTVRRRRRDTAGRPGGGPGRPTLPEGPVSDLGSVLLSLQVGCPPRQ